MSSRKKRRQLRKQSNPMYILEGLEVEFTSGPCEGHRVLLLKRNIKELGTATDNDIINYSNDVRMLMRDVRLDNLLN
jgi:hypothetical protein